MNPEIDEAGIEELISRVSDMESLIAELRGKVSVIEGVTKQAGQLPIGPIQGLGATKLDIRLWGSRGKNKDKSNNWDAMGVLPGGILPVLAGLDGTTQQLINQFKSIFSNLVAATADPAGAFTVANVDHDITLDASFRGETVWISNVGASADVELTVPTLSVGHVYKIKVTEPYYIKLTMIGGSGADQIRDVSEESVPGGYIRSNEPGAIIILRCFEAQWGDVSEGKRGTWSIDS